MHTITDIMEPNRLLLCWQPISDDQDRTRRIVGEIVRRDNEYTLRYFADSDDFKKAVASGFNTYPAFRDIDKEYTHGVLETFMLRLPPSKREDYSYFLRSLRLPLNSNISAFALLGYSEAKLPGDGFSIINPFDDAPIPCQFLAEVAGFRHHNGPNMDIQIGEAVSFVAEPDNKFDPMAIGIVIRDEVIGYVNRCQTSAFQRWLGSRLLAVVEKKNGTPTKPRLLIFVEAS